MDDALGSTKDFKMFEKVDFELPISPFKTQDRVRVLMTKSSQEP